MDALYSRLNARGRKQYKGAEKQEFEQTYPTYSKIGLPAHKAALDGDVSCLRDFYLSKHQKDEGVPSRDVNGATPLHLASRTNRIEVIRWVLRFTDLSPLTVAKHGETPAHVAAAQGHIDCLKLMLGAEGKADIKNNLATSVDNSGFTALHLAIVKYRNECAKVLITELGTKGVGALNESGITAAHVAASAGNVDILKLLSQKYKKLMTQEAADGTTPVYFAAQEGRLDAVKFLSTKVKCDLTTPSNDGLKPIHAASQCGHTHIVKYIVSRLGNSSVFDSTPDGATPLHFAASSGQVLTARWLINSDVGGSLIVTKDKNGDTAAHDAADNGQCGVLKLLLESGADLYAMNNEGNTPYSLALSGQDADTANFVMTYASKSPQKQDTGPSQMTIYDLQGDMDVVNIEAAEPVPAQNKEDEPDTSVVESVKHADAPSGKKASKKAKKEKGKKKSSGSTFLDSSATAQALKALETDKNPKQAPDLSDDLDMTDEDLAIFKPEESRPLSTNEPLVSDEGDIVVRYSRADQSVSPQKNTPDSRIASSDYSTVNELAEREERKKKKHSRKLSKSIQNALKPGKKKVADSSKQSNSIQKAFSGPEMGFKPQFKSNPLQRLTGADAHIPPTPPPTPATGASIAPSEDTHQSNLQEVEEEEDGNPYDLYSDPDSNPSKRHEQDEPKEKQTVDSENTKLLEDALDDLSDEETPPHATETKLSSEEGEKTPVSATSVGSDKVSPKLMGKVWPPPAEDARDREPDSSPRVKPSQASVLKKWQPQEWKKESKQPPPTKIDIGGWLKNVTEKDKPGETEVAEQDPVSTKMSSSIPARDSLSHEKHEPAVFEDVPTKAFVSLKPVKKEQTSSSKSSSKENELAKIKLKSSGGKQGASFSKPETEIASGASDELLKFLKGRQ